jgi:hypothetical protein
VKKPTLIKPDGSDATTLSPAQQECIKLLTEMLDGAKQGQISSLVVVACGPLDFGHAIAGSDAPRLMLGLKVAEDDIVKRTTDGARAIRR